ncbi:hypothetical protein KIH27_01690 [Mycobacterium sp. M1]|uniref:Uncharacterized protein n=1 Tax=Mycolicibacter acidiphilus TaxID=2835306 RepID=A0ABS5RFQ5_9MYCO|nr:hypothetical protein [Mycolicibacter acidiphilus]MBS9532296.1 hypothetical protein [Mycolicibacter acidiphilus]
MNPNTSKRSFADWQSGHPPIPAEGVDALISAPPPDDWREQSEQWLAWIFEGVSILGWTMTQYGNKMVIASGPGAPSSLSRGLPIIDAIKTFLSLPEPSGG